MERGDQKSTEGYYAGGIISLAKIINDHREAVEYDLLTATGYQLRDIGSSLSWSAMRAFLTNAKVDTAFIQELHPEYAGWATRTKTNSILADIYDILANINANLIAIGSGRPAKKPKPYPRPKQKDEEQRRIGRGALPPDELRRWFEEKRAKHAGSSKRDTDSEAGA